MALDLALPMLVSLNQGQDLDEEFTGHAGVYRGIGRSLAPNIVESLYQILHEKGKITEGKF